MNKWHTVLKIPDYINYAEVVHFSKFSRVFAQNFLKTRSLQDWKSWERRKGRSNDCHVDAFPFVVLPIFSAVVPSRKAAGGCEGALAPDDKNSMVS